MNLLPVQYYSQKIAWMSTDIFLELFKKSFVPTVQRDLGVLGLEKKAVLVLDNCLAHPDSEYLVSDDGKVTWFLGLNSDCYISQIMEKDYSNGVSCGM